MPNMRSLTATAASIAVLLTSASALVLQDLPHNDGLKYSKRGDPLGCLDLKSEESFLWGAADENQAALGNLTVFMPNAQENVLSMERFSDMLTSVNCTQSTIDMAFEDDETFAYAKAVWDWVNGEENDTFVMVAGTGACEWNTDHRQPFRVTTLSFDEDANIAHLAAEALEWSQAIHSYKLNVGGFPSKDLHKRAFGEINYNKDLNLDFNHQFPVDTVSLPMPDGVTATLDLSNCSTSGAFAFQFNLETFLLIPKKAEMSVHPQGVALTVAPSLTLAGNISEPRTADLQLVRINLAGIQIPAGILDIGPEVVLSVGATIGPLYGETTVEAGVVYSLDDGAVASVDIMAFEAEQSGWTPRVEETPLTVTAELDGTVKAFVKAELELVAKAFGVGFDLGVGIAPFIAADLQTVTAESGSCGTSDGLALSPSYGIDLILDAHTPFNGEDDPLFEITLFSLEQPLPGTCLPFDNSDVVPAQVSSGSSFPTASSAAAAAITSSTSSTVSSSASLVTSAPVGSYSSFHAFASSSADAGYPLSSEAAIAQYTAATSSFVTIASSSSVSSTGSIIAEASATVGPQYRHYGYSAPKHGYAVD